MDKERDRSEDKENMSQEIEVKLKDALDEWLLDYSYAENGSSGYVFDLYESMRAVIIKSVKSSAECPK